MKKNRNIVIKIFLFFIFAIYPFYIENGYDGIDSAKNEFLFLCLLFFIPLMLIARIIKWLSDSIANKKLTDKNVIRSRVSLDCVDFFMALYVYLFFFLFKT